MKTNKEINGISYQLSVYYKKENKRYYWNIVPCEILDKGNGIQIVSFCPSDGKSMYCTELGEVSRYNKKFHEKLFGDVSSDFVELVTKYKI